MHCLVAKLISLFPHESKGSRSAGPEDKQKRSEKKAERNSDHEYAECTGVVEQPVGGYRGIGLYAPTIMKADRHVLRPRGGLAVGEHNLGAPSPEAQRHRSSPVTLQGDVQQDVGLHRDADPPHKVGLT